MGDGVQKMDGILHRGRGWGSAATSATLAVAGVAPGLHRHAALWAELRRPCGCLWPLARSGRHPGSAQRVFRA